MITASHEHDVDDTSMKWIGSMLYNYIIIDSLLRRLGNQSLWAQGFTDDVVLKINGKFLSTVCERMQRALSQIQNWCEEVELSGNSNKTTAILFTKNRNLNALIKFILFGSELDCKTWLNTWD
jgi:hypothetical protein